jgi:3-hydroxyisobutyrate dehydrogenase-like beta-hydroxyacid dehydrogenase
MEVTLTVEDRPLRIGFIGVGHMGKHMAASLLRGGHTVTICDARPQARDEPVLVGARWADTPAAAVRDADAAVTSLPGPPQVTEVVLGADGVLEGISPGALYIDMSTSTPDNIRDIARAAQDKDVTVVDAPVAGGMRGARKGTLTIMAGATEPGFVRALPLLECMGTTVIRVGDVGAGHVAKLVNNMMTIMNALVAMEAIVVGVKAGVNPAKLIEVAQAGTGGSFSLNAFPYVIFRRAFDPAKFATALAAKDLRISAEYARELGVDLSLIPIGADLLTRASDSGLEQQAKVEVRP